jgi:hypothetical protein
LDWIIITTFRGGAGMSMTTSATAVVPKMVDTAAKATTRMDRIARK